jgi:chromosomal replication initiator protein
MACCEDLRPQVSPGVWASTFADATALTLAGGTLVVAVPSGVVKERLEGAYLSLVQSALRTVHGEPIDLLVEVRTAPASAPMADDPLDLLLGRDGGRPHPELTPPNGSNLKLPVGSEVDMPRYTFDAFVTGPSNRFAHAAALSVAEMPGRHYNPLFIYGEAGLGKTHLLQAISHYVRNNYLGSTVRYVSSETFLNEFVDSIRTGTNDQFKRRYREVDVLLVDDIQFLENRKETQEEFFHTFNALHAADRQIVLSSDRSPDAISTLENRLRSRFKMGLITDIQPPDLETRLAILRKKAEVLDTAVPDEVLEFIATNITDNIRELEGALTRVTAYAGVYHELLSISLAARVLSDTLGDGHGPQITPERILQLTSEKFGFPVDEIMGKSRRRPLVTARQVAMYVMREVTDLSYPAIAREFGGRDHTTVIHAVEKISALMQERRQIYDQVTDLIQRIRRG